MSRSLTAFVSDLPDCFRGRRCLVTGGAGFIGSNLTRHLLALGAAVTVVDNFATGKRANLPAATGLEIVEADISSHRGLPELLTGVDYVFHLAAQVGNVKSIERTEDDARANIIGTVRLLEACRRTSIVKLVYSSSSAIFGEATSLPIAEEHPQRPASFYAQSKLTGEKYALLEQTLSGVPTVCLRYFNVFGLPMENNEYTGVISIFFDRLQQRLPLVIYGDGEQRRDFVHVADVVRANLLAAATAAPGRVYNIGSGSSVTVKELAEKMIELTGIDLPVRFEPPRLGEVRDSGADISRARGELGYEPLHDLPSGLRAMWQADLVPFADERPWA